MTKREKDRRSLDEILDSISESLHFAGVDRKTMTVHSRAPDGDTPLHLAAFRGDQFAVRQLLEGGADIEAVGDMGYTALHNAVIAGHVDAAALLLEYGANPDALSEFGETPRAMARSSGSKELAPLFVGKGPHKARGRKA